MAVYTASARLMQQTHTGDESARDNWHMLRAAIATVSNYMIMFDNLSIICKGVTTMIKMMRFAINYWGFILWIGVAVGGILLDVMGVSGSGCAGCLQMAAGMAGY